MTSLVLVGCSNSNPTSDLTKDDKEKTESNKIITGTASVPDTTSTASNNSNNILENLANIINQKVIAKVLDGHTALQNANITVKYIEGEKLISTNITGKTDENGNFTLTVENNKDCVILVTKPTSETDQTTRLSSIILDDGQDKTNKDINAATTIVAETLSFDKETLSRFDNNDIQDFENNITQQIQDGNLELSQEQLTTNTDNTILNSEFEQGLKEPITINFPDKNLESIIRNSSEIEEVLPDTGIYYTQAKQITTINANNSAVTSLEGLQFLSNLKSLDIGSDSEGVNSNEVNNIRYLSALNNLEVLKADLIGISDISGLSELDSLTTIILSNNQIENISPITTLNNLKELWLNDNQIKDISGLENVGVSNYLDIANNYLVKSDNSVQQLINKYEGTNILNYEPQKEPTEDTTPPEINLDQSNGDITNTNSITISGMVDDPNAEVMIEGEQVTLDEDGSFNKEVSLTEGDNTITITATDSSGNVTRKDIKLTVDTTDPEISVTNITDGQSYDTPVTPEVNASDDTNTTEEITLTKNGQEITDYTEGTEISAAGNYSLEITATDEAGNTSTVNITFTINDITPPEISLNQSTDNLVNNSEFTVSGSVDEEATVFIEGNEVSVVNNQFSVTVNLSEGENLIRIKAEDMSGNVSTKDITATLDTVDPLISVTGVKSGSSYNEPQTPIINREEDGASYNWDIVLYRNGTEVTSYNKNEEISEPGNYELNITATDQAGNQSNIICTFTINSDTTAPTIQLNQSSGELVNTSTYTVSGTVSESATVNVNTKEINLDNLSFTTDITLSEGENVITISAQDVDGNSSSVQLTVYLDTTSPSISIGNIENNGEYNSTVIPSINMDEDGNLTLNLQKDGNTIDYTKGSSINNPGNYILTVEAEDSAGNVSSKQCSFTIYNSPKNLSISSSYDSNNNNMVISLDEILDITSSNLNYPDLVNNFGINLDTSKISLNDGNNSTNLTLTNINNSTEHVIDDTNDNIVLSIKLIAEKIMNNQIAFNTANFDGDEKLVVSLSGTNTLDWTITREIPLPDQVKVNLLKYILDNYNIDDPNANNILGELIIGTINDGDGGSAYDLLNNIGFNDYVGSEVNIEFLSSEPTGLFDTYGTLDVTANNQTADVNYKIAIGANNVSATTSVEILNQGIESRIIDFEDMMLNEDSTLLNNIISSNGLNSNFNDLSQPSVDMSKQEAITAIETDWAESNFLTFEFNNSSIQYNFGTEPKESTFDCDYLIEVDKTPDDGNSEPDYIFSGTAQGKFIYENKQWNIRELVFTASNNNEIVTFTDPDLETAIRNKINKPDGYIYKSDLTSITNLQAPNSNIDDLSGIENLVNLEILNLGIEEVNGSWVNSNSISDLTPLANLTNLNELLLYRNNISDLSPLSNLTNLTRLSADFNSITNITPLKNLTSLTRLDLRDNSISDISDLSNLTNLTSLDLSINNISNITSLGSLVNLEWLAITENSITDISNLSSLTRLNKLYIYLNQIDDVTPLASCTSLLQLDIGDNNISDISSLSTLTNLEGFYFESNPLTNIEVLSQLNNLSQVRMYNIDFDTGSRQVIDELKNEGVTVEYDSNNLNSYPDINISKTINDLSVTLNGSITDSDGSISEVTINWGDGSNDVISTGFDTINKTHAYAENKNYTITVTATDNEGLAQNIDIAVEFNYTVVTFADPDLENIIRNKINKATGDIYKSDVSSIEVLEIPNQNIDLLDGIEALESLRYLNLGFKEDDGTPHTQENNSNSVSDLTPLTNLTNLESLIMWGNEISNLNPLSNLTNLNNLHLNFNNVSDVSPLQSLTNLQYLEILFNQVSDISSLSSLTNLQFVHLEYNSIDDISAISNWNQIESLWLNNNQITDVTPLQNLTTLKELYLANNPIDDYSPLSGIYDQLTGKDFVINNEVITIADSNLEQVVRDKIGKQTGDLYKNDVIGIRSLNADSMNISSLEGLQHFESLQSLYLTNNQISDLTPLANLTNLKQIGMWGNSITDISPLAGLTDLYYLSLNGNSIENIDTLDYSKFTNLEVLEFGDNNISDITSLNDLNSNLIELELRNNPLLSISPISHLTSLEILELGDGGIVDITPLDNLTNLRELYLSENGVSDITTLANLTSLERLEMVNNSITDVTALSGLENLVYLSLKSNQITDVNPLSGLINLNTLYLSGNNISDYSPLEPIYDQLENKDFQIGTDEIVSFTDSNLEQFVRDKIGIQTGDIYESDVINITELYAYEQSITTLDGLEYFKNLTDLDLAFNSISDITPLTNLTQLNYLNLKGNNISDVNALSGLTNLDTLFIKGNLLSTTEYTNLSTLNSQLVNKDFILEEDLTDISAKINELFTAVLNENKTDIAAVVYNNGIEVIGPNMDEHYQPNEFADLIAANYWEATEPQHATYFNLESNTINSPGVEVETYMEVDNIDPIFNNYYYEFKKDSGIWYFTKFEDQFTPTDTSNWTNDSIDYETTDQVNVTFIYPESLTLTDYTDSQTGKIRYQIEDLSNSDVHDVKLQLRPDTNIVDSSQINTEAEFDTVANNGFNNLPDGVNMLGYEKTTFSGFPAYKMLYEDTNGKGYGYLVFNSNNTLVYLFQYYKPVDQFANDLNLGKTLMDHISF